MNHRGSFSIADGWRLPALAACLVAVSAAVAPARAAESIVVASDEASGIYPAGKDVVFTIKPGEGAGAVDLGKVSVKIVFNGLKEVAPAEKKNDGASVSVRLKPEAGGWYRCEASLPLDAQKPLAASAGVVAGPDAVKPSVPEPKDLDEFWAAKKAALAAAPIKAETKALSEERKNAVAAFEKQGIECVDVEIPCPDTRPLRGYYARSKSAGPGSSPAILYLRAAGVSGNWCKASPGNAVWLAKSYAAIVLDTNAHGMLNDQPKEYYEKLEKGELLSYASQGKTGRDTFYFVGMYMRLLRGIEFLCAQKEWDGKHLICIGESQGGGQALAAAGLDKRVSAVVAVVPALCDLTGGVARRLAGWPNPVGGNAESEEAKKIIEAVRYCDNVHLSSRSQAETLIFVGLVDVTCPPPGVFAAYNNLPGRKRILAYPHKGHGGLPQEDKWVGDIPKVQEAFIRQHIGPAK